MLKILEVQMEHGFDYLSLALKVENGNFKINHSLK